MKKISLNAYVDTLSRLEFNYRLSELDNEDFFWPPNAYGPCMTIALSNVAVGGHRTEFNQILLHVRKWARF